MPTDEGIEDHECTECGRHIRHDWRLHASLHDYFRVEEARGHFVPGDL